jgi:predicted nucleic acid-binding protein
MTIVDTDVAIDVLRGRREAHEVFARLLRARTPLLASEITRFEILSGMRPEEQARTEAFLSFFRFVPVTEAIARRAAQFVREHRPRNTGIENEDYLVAATAALLDVPLLTRNIRHYPMFPGLAPAY